MSVASLTMMVLVLVFVMTISSMIGLALRLVRLIELLLERD